MELSTGKGKGNRWWGVIIEENLLFDIAMKHLRPLATAWMEFAANVMYFIWAAVTNVGLCNQEISSYKNEEEQRMMKRKHDNWDGIAPEKCAICEIEL